MVVSALLFRPFSFYDGLCQDLTVRHPQFFRDFINNQKRGAKLPLRHSCLCPAAGRSEHSLEFYRLAVKQISCTEAAVRSDDLVVVLGGRASEGSVAVNRPSLMVSIP